MRPPGGAATTLTTNDELLGFGRTVNTLASCAEYRRGYLTGIVRGDANLKVYRYQRAGRTHGDVHRFRLALADVEGLDRTQDYLDRDGIHHTVRFHRGHASAACNDRDPYVVRQLRGPHQ